jgi:hypothetical protein
MSPQGNPSAPARRIGVRACEGEAKLLRLLLAAFHYCSSDRPRRR